MNAYTPTRYGERTFHLALGIEPRDANAGNRLVASVAVRLERFPKPVDRWRAWRPGETLTQHLPPMHRHRTGRFIHCYDDDPAATPKEIDLRIVDDRLVGSGRDAGQGRTIVPRRLRIPVATRKVVVDAEADPNLPPHPVWRRTFPFGCFPGAAAPLSSRATVLRGRIVTDPGSGDLVPVRWARVRARDDKGHDLGWAHGDDRGEFVLVLTPVAGGIIVPASPLKVELRVGADPTPPTPDPADPLLAEVDPLWDLPVETVTPSATPASEPSITGRKFLPVHFEYTPLAPVQPFDVPVGRETSVVVQIG